MQQPTLFIIIGIGIVIAIRRFSPIIAGILGLLLTIGVAVWGVLSFKRGAALAFAGYEITQPVFLGFVAVWCGIEVWGLNRALKARRARLDETNNEASEDTPSGS